MSRPEKPTAAQIREVCQPPSVRGRRNSEHWVADVYLRDISPHLTRYLVRTPISANQVTGLMILTGVGSAAALLIPGLPGGFLAAILGQMQMLWDCCDGEVARWRGTSSPTGVFLDRVGHYLTEAPDVAAPRRSGLRRIRALARFVPFHRAYHSVELTLLALIATIIDAFVGDLLATQVLVAALLGFGLITLVGHFIAIVTSGRLR